MLDDTKSGMQCIEWEALLADALDGTLHGSTLAGFEEHQKACPTCHAMYEEVAAGLHWMKALDEAEPPKYLVHNILAQTIGALPVETAPAATPGESWWERLKGRVAPVFAPVFSPRFAMSFGMAFFSITMLLNVAGFHVSDLKHVDLSAQGNREDVLHRTRREWSVTTRTFAWFTRLSLACAICAAPRPPIRSRRNRTRRRNPKAKRSGSKTANMKTPAVMCTSPFWRRARLQL